MSGSTIDPIRLPNVRVAEKNEVTYDPKSKTEIKRNIERISLINQKSIDVIFTRYEMFSTHLNEINMHVLLCIMQLDLVSTDIHYTKSVFI